MNTCLKTGFALRIADTDYSADLYADLYDNVTVVFHENPMRPSALPPEAILDSNKKVKDIPYRREAPYRVSSEPLIISPDFRKILLKINPDRSVLIKKIKVGL